MKYIIAIVLSLFAVVALAKTVASLDVTGGAILLTDEPCDGTPYHKFMAQDDKATLLRSGCWFGYGSTVIGLWEDGGVSTAPAEAFTWNIDTSHKATGEI